MLRFVLVMLIAASQSLAPQERTKEGGGPPSDQPASQPAARTLPRSPRQAEIFKALLSDTRRRGGPPILSQEPGGTGEPAEGDGALLLEGTVLWEQAGRLVRSGDQSLFHFKSGSLAGGASEAIEFNKNGSLEAMESEAEAGVKEFVIWAEVTRYRGRNYLNLLKYRRQVAHGNLSP